MNGLSAAAERSIFDAVMPFVLLPDACMLGIQTGQRGVTGIAFLPAQAEQAPQTALAEQVKVAINAYFTDPSQVFYLPLDLHGSDFQQRVWRQLAEIRAGHPLTYGELADVVGSGARAVGNACRHNPLPVLLPCHRVVAKSGLGGFAGSTQGRLMDIKQALLAHERVAE